MSQIAFSIYCTDGVQQDYFLGDNSVECPLILRRYILTINGDKSKDFVNGMRIRILEKVGDRLIAQMFSKNIICAHSMHNSDKILNTTCFKVNTLYHVPFPRRFIVHKD